MEGRAMSLALSDTFARELKAFRVKMNYKQEYFCKLLEISQPTLSRIENRKIDVQRWDVSDMVLALTNAEPQRIEGAFKQTEKIFNETA
jgi:predicted transcriptional regulator